MDIDGDVLPLSRDDLIDEVRRLREGIRRHRDTTGHDLCWFHPQLWGLLPESTDPLPPVPEWAQFMRGCVRFRQSLDVELPRRLERPRSMAADQGLTRGSTGAMTLDKPIARFH